MKAAARVATSAREAPPARAAQIAQPQAEAPNPVWGSLAVGAQAKLAVSAPDDPSEREAERVAQQVMRMGERTTPVAVSAAPPMARRVCDACTEDVVVQRACDACEEEAASTAQRAAQGAEPNGAALPEGWNSGGAPLDDATRAFMEPRFGQDFSAVRVHTDARATAAAQSLSARAFTVGSDIAFARGRYQPGTADGATLLAHELTHVVQQCSGAARAIQRDDGEEEEVLDEEEAPAEAEDYGEAFLDEVYDFIEFMEALGICETTAWAMRGRLLILFADRALPEDDTEAEAWREWFSATSADEDATIDELGFDVVDLAPDAFPLTWAWWVEEAITLEVDVESLFEEVLEAHETMALRAESLPQELWERGLPIGYEEVQRLRRFLLRASHAQMEGDHPVRDFALLVSAYTRRLYLFTFAQAWQDVVDSIVESIEGCEYTPDPESYYDYLDNYAAILVDLPDRLGRVLSEEEMLEAEADTFVVADAALVAAFAGGLFGFLSILSGWSTGSERFDEALAAADEIVAGAGDTEKFITAVTWAAEHGYFGDAGEQILDAILAQLPEIIGMTAAIIAAQFVPGLNVAVDVVLMIVSGADVIASLAGLASAISAVFSATTMLGLQRASANLALSLLGDGLGLFIDLAMASVSLRAARGRAAELRRLDPHLSEEQALRRALSESGDATARQLGRASEYSAWEGSVSRETREALAANPALREVYARADPAVRRLLTVCRSPCIPTRPAPTAASLARIKRLMDDLSLEDTHPGLREYLYENRHNINDAVAGFDDIHTPSRLQELFEQDIRRHATELGGTAATGPDGRWTYRRSDGTSIAEYEQARYGHLLDNRGSDDFFQAHHGVQDAWAEQVGVPGYSRRGAPALLLRDRRAGTPHQRISARQTGRRSTRGSRTYADERDLLLEDLRAADVPEDIITDHLQRQDDYFGQLYRDASTTRTPAELERWFGDWTPD